MRIQSVGSLDIDSKRALRGYTLIAPLRRRSVGTNAGGARRLPNEYTLIGEGINGRAFEVTREGAIVWEYVSPFVNTLFAGDGPSNALFRVYRYSADSAEIGGRLAR